jgi:hypothetical protein
MALIKRFARHVWLSRPGLRLTLAAGTLWPLAIVMSAMGSALLARHAMPPEALRISVIFALGAALAAPLACWFVAILALDQPTARFAAALVLLTTVTLAITAFLFGYDFWWYFAQWHGETLSQLWFVQLIFTFASAIYQFLVAGLRLYVPFGVFALIAASAWIARQTSR